MKKVEDRFIEYVKVDTQSAQDADCFPSTEKQKNLAVRLRDELQSFGVQDVYYDTKYGYIYAGIPSNMEGKTLPVIGFISHMDTSPAVTGTDVKPQIIEKYNGKDVILNEAEHVVLSVSDNQELLNYTGQTLIVTDGTTLLGADDKAGVAEIMTMVEYLMCHPEIKHGDIKIAFTPDEEVGRGVDFFDIPRFGAQFAYTVDGGALGELEYENFNAAGAKVTVNGLSVHPGNAKNKMKNSILIAQEFQQLLPMFENPASTEEYEGFYHLDHIDGVVEQTTMEYIIRDHDMEKFLKKKSFFLQCADFLNQKYGQDTIVIDMNDSYYNMKEKILPHMHLIENAKNAMIEVGITPNIIPIRGGTDGARLSFSGLPCPNLCTGGHNFHGKYEYICVESMQKIVELILKIVELYSEKE